MCMHTGAKQFVSANKCTKNNKNPPKLVIVKRNQSPTKQQGF